MGIVSNNNEMIVCANMKKYNEMFFLNNVQEETLRNWIKTPNWKTGNMVVRRLTQGMLTEDSQLDITECEHEWLLVPRICPVMDRRLVQGR